MAEASKAGGGALWGREATAGENGGMLSEVGSECSLGEYSAGERHRGTSPWFKMPLEQRGLLHGGVCVSHSPLFSSISMIQ